MSPATIRLESGGALCEDFAPLVDNFDLSELDQQHATIYGIQRDRTLAYVNARWFEFAHANNAPPDLTEPDEIFGRPLSHFFAGPMRKLYESILDRIFDTSQPFSHEYECSSPERFRIYHGEILPLPESEATPRGALVINSLSSTSPRSADDDRPLDNYLTDDGLLISCSNCRRFRHCDDHDRWDWLPDCLDDPPVPVSHGICTVCLEYYHSKVPAS